MSGSEPDLTHVRVMWAADDASRALGIEVLDVGVDTTDAERLGHARTRMAVTGAMVNGHDIVHGGYIFTLADSTFALACNATGQLTVAAGADITFVSPARRGDVLVAQARERVRYGRSGVADVTVTREADGAVVAEFRGRSRALPPAASGADPATDPRDHDAVTLTRDRCPPNQRLPRMRA